MGRIKQTQNIDNAIQSIEIITKNLCSLSELDQLVLNEAVEKLHKLKKKKGKTNQQIQNELAQVLVLITKFYFQ